MKTKFSQIGLLIAALVVGGYYVYAGAVKILDPEQFSLDIYYFKLMSHDMVNLLALFLPWLELFAGLSLICIPLLRQGAAVLVGLMSIVFIFALSINIVRGNVDISCGCLSKGSSNMIGWRDVLKNVVFLGLAGVVFVMSRKPVSGEK